MKFSHLLTILIGVVLLTVVIVLTQFLTIMTVNADIETASPVGWAVGLIFSIVIVLAVMRWLTRRQILSRASLVILWTMLTVAVPLSNIGLVRPWAVTLAAVTREYMLQGTSTYRTAYNAQKPAWFPVAPTQRGLAWHRADRLLRLLQDNDVIKKRIEARKQVMTAIVREAQRLQRGGEPGTRPAATLRTKPTTAPTTTAPTRGSPDAPTEEEMTLDEAVGALWVDEIETVLDLDKPEAMESLGIKADIEARYEQAKTASERAARQVPELLAEFSEYEASLLPSNYARLSRSAKELVERDLASIAEYDPDFRAGLMARVEKLKGLEDEFRTRVSQLSEADWRQARSTMEKQYLDRFAEMDDETVARLRHSFVLRLDRSERNDIITQAGKRGEPNQFYQAFTTSLWPTLQEQKRKEERSLWENLFDEQDGLFYRLPWHIWVGPMITWGLLFTAIFLLLMCTAEWLRRKWIERENLAFPLVEIADQMIRHDRDLEMATDPDHPPKRPLTFSPAFIVGALLGLLILSVEALGHYEFLNQPHTISFNVSKEILTTGAFREMDKVFLVLSPIVVGIAFLISLELSFSIWVIFLLYTVVVWIPKVKGIRLVDPIYSGWAGGRTYPFPMEQLLGATLCFTIILLIKSFRSGRAVGPGGGEGGFYVRPLWMRVGFVAAPLAILALLWYMGVTSWVLLILVIIFVGAQTIAAARVRAETGLFTHHVSYEYTKFPMVFGLTGLTGAEVYTRYISLAFLPVSLLFRALPQQLENIELARRYKLKLRVIATATLVAFVVAIVVGMVSLMVFSHYRGEEAYAGKAHPEQQNMKARSIAHYPLWVSHFLGEQGLETYTSPRMVRVWFVLIGFGVFGLLTFLRKRFLRFPLNPLGYLLLLMSIYFHWVSPYVKGTNEQGGREASMLWGSVFAAWMIKKLIIKYGGMNTYKRAKPFFVGLVVGSVFCLFAWNMVDLGCSIAAEYAEQPGEFMKHFLEKTPYTPKFY